MKYLCVAEKNDAAKKISGFLSNGGTRRREGKSQYNKIYEFDINFRGQQSTIVFTSVSGHLLTHDFTSAFKNWHSCNPEQLFDAPISKICPENFVKIRKTLEAEIVSCTDLIIWTDCDREGENIGFEIIDVCRAVKPRINVHRAKFSDMTAASLHRALQNLIQPDERVSHAVDVRSELDLRIGAAFTRLQTLRLQKVFPENIPGNIVSYGSCQIPTLGFVVQRYKEIENFITRPFWKIKLTHTMNSLTVDFSWNRNRLFDKTCCETFLILCQADGVVRITNVLQKPKSKWRPQPMDTIELEKTGSRKLKLSAKVIMTIAERLYTQGYISYPRTETNQFSKDINLRPLVEMQTQNHDWGEFARKVLEWGPNPRNGNKSDQAHPPIHPTKYVETLQGDEKRVYELIVRHFLACNSKDAVGSETLVSAIIGREEFTATGLIVLEKNYLDVYVYDRWSGKEIHEYQNGQTFNPTDLSLHEGSTTPPGMLTEADLIALMDKHGIGTDATHAEHIATVKDRGYIGEIDQGHLVPGTLGMGLVEGYEMMNLELAQPKLRAGLEEDLKAICLGQKNPQDVLREQIRKYKECYQIISRELQVLDQTIGQRFGAQPQAVVHADIPAMQEVFKCPKCRRSSMAIRQKKDNGDYFISCLRYPDCRNAVWFPNDVKSLTALDELCGNCGGQNKKIKIKFSRIAMLGLVNENAAFSRVEGTEYITCLVCDNSLRDLLAIRADTVKVLGNIVGVSNQPVQPNIQRPNGGDLAGRNFGTNANQRRGWGNDDDNDNNRRPGGGGAVAVDNQNRGWNANQNNNQRRGWGNDDDNDNNRRPGGGGAVAVSNQNRGWNASVTSNPTPQTDQPSIVSCKCEKPSKVLTVFKEGPNKGRLFYVCNTSKCNFFQWLDGPAPVNHQQLQPSTSSGATGATGTKRKCGVCRQEGHNKKNCPNR